MSRPYIRPDTTTATGTGNVTPALPPNWKENDILLLLVQSANEAAAAPAGYTELSSSPQGTGTAATIGSTRLTVFWKRATSSESAPTVTDTGDHTYCAMCAVAGCITTGSPFDVQSGDVEAVADDNITWPGVTTTVDNALVLNLMGASRFGSYPASVTNADLLNPTVLLSASVQTGVDGGIVIAYGFKPDAGSVATTTATFSAANTATQGRITVALKPEVDDVPFMVSKGTFVTATSSGSPTPGLPPGYAADDIFLMAVETANQAPASAPTGYAEVTDSPQGTGTAGTAGATRLTVYWKRATGSESAVSVPGTGNHTFAQIICIRGCAASGDPWEDTAGDVEAVASTAVTVPAVTAGGNNRLIVSIVAYDTDTNTAQATLWTNANLTAFAEVTDEADSSLTGGGLAIALGTKATSGDAGATTATLLGAATQGRIALAFPPGGGGGGAAWVPRIIMC